MPTVFRYVNLHPYPVVVSGKSGSQVLFKTGDFATDKWFSRFVNVKELTKVAVDVSRADAIRGEIPLVPTPPAPKSLAGPPEEDTRDFVRKRGIYFCKHCDLFRTGSRKAFAIHLKELHQMVSTSEEPKRRRPKVKTVPTPEEAPPKVKLIPKKLPPVIPLPVEVQEDVVVTTLTSGKKEPGDFVPGGKGTMAPEVPSLAPVVPETPVRRSITPVQPQPPSAVTQEAPVGLPCPVVGCIKRFKSKAGLSSHLRSKHPDFLAETSGE